MSPSAAARELVFRARDVRKVYTSGAVRIEALKGIDLDVHSGEFIVLLGASGSGKSTLLNILGGLDIPSSGELRWRDHDLARADERELTRFRREHVGFVFQFYNLIGSLTARENVALVTDLADDPLRPEDALAMVGLSDRLDHFPAQLSGGEQQRVAIARAVAKRPDVLLCDEPTGALDYPTGKLVLEIGDPNSLEAVIEVLSQDALRIAAGMPVRLVASRSSPALLGTVQRVEPSGRTKISTLGVEEQRVNVIVDFSSAQDMPPTLGDGFRIEASIIVMNKAQVPVVPIGALFRNQEQWSVFVAQEGTARLRSVTLEARNQHQAWISKGLSVGETVIVYPPDTVADGVRIKAR